MSRKYFFDILKERYNTQEEIIRIAKLFNSELLWTTHHNGLYDSKCGMTFEKFIDKNCFHLWPGRNTCLNTTDLKNSLKIYYNKIHDPAVDSENDVLLFLEYYINMINLAEKSEKFKKYSLKFEEWFMLHQNIDSLLDHMNQQIIKDDKKSIYFIIQKNAQSIATAEIAPESVSFSILRYNHRTLQGDLGEKRKILEQISHEYESLLKQPPQIYQELFVKTRGLLNNLNIRHNNKDKNIKNEKINLSDKDLEKWYDDLYQMLLLCILINDNIKEKRNEKAKELINSL